jgi:hypothetical protein
MNSEHAITAIKVATHARTHTHRVQRLPQSIIPSLIECAAGQTLLRVWIRSLFLRVSIRGSDSPAGLDLLHAA